MKLFKKRAYATDGATMGAAAGKKENGFLAILKGAVIAILTSIVSILIFALIIKFVSVSDELIKGINQGIKVLSVLIGTLVTTSKNKQAGLFKGILVGVFYSLLSFLVFSAMDGSFNLDITILNDCLFAAIAGAVSGVIGVNVGKSRM